MALILRTTNGAPLTWDQGDQNLIYLYSGSLYNPYSGSVTVSGSIHVSGSIVASNFVGTASTASYVNNLNQAVNITGSLIITGSFALATQARPSASTEIPGQIYFDNFNSNFYGWNGSAWVQLNN